MGACKSLAIAEPVKPDVGVVYDVDKTPGCECKQDDDAFMGIVQKTDDLHLNRKSARRANELAGNCTRIVDVNEPRLVYGLSRNVTMKSDNGRHTLRFSPKSDDADYDEFEIKFAKGQVSQGVRLSYSGTGEWRVSYMGDNPNAFKCDQ
jgi:hypothetical protein